MLEMLSNGHFSLERLKESDSNAVYEAVLSSKLEISPWLSWLTPKYNQQECNEFIRLQINNWDSDIEYTYAIKNNSNEILGLIGLHVFDPLNDVASIGYWMNTKFTKQGICTDAVKLLVKNALLPLNLIRIEVIVATTNKASQKVAIKAGGVFESELKNRIRLNGQAINAYLYCFIPES